MGVFDDFKKQANEVRANVSKQKPSQPAQTNWYKGSQPTQRETLARIYEIGKQDETKRVDLMRMYEEEVKNPSSPIYNPYTDATTTKATKTNINNPLKAQDEWARLSDELSYWATRTDRNYSDDEIISRINWDNYKTLQKMDEGRVSGSPMALLEGVGYSKDAMYGVLWSARNPGASTGNAMYDAVQGALGRGNAYVRDDQTAERLNPMSPSYNPYVVGSTMDDMAYTYRTDRFDEQWLEENRSMLLNPETAADYGKIYNAVQNTNAMREEAEALKAELARYAETGTEPDFGYLLSQSKYKTLAKMQESLKSGQIMDTAYGIDFDLPTLMVEAAAAYQLKQAKLNAAKDPVALQTVVDSEKTNFIERGVEWWGSLFKDAPSIESETMKPDTVYDESPAASLSKGMLWAGATRPSKLTEEQRRLMIMSGELPPEEASYSDRDMASAIENGDYTSAAAMNYEDTKRKIEEDPELLTTDNVQKAAMASLSLVATSPNPEDQAAAEEYAKLVEASMGMDTSNPVYEFVDEAFGGALSETSDNEGLGFWKTARMALQTGGDKFNDVLANIAGAVVTGYGYAVEGTNKVMNWLGIEGEIPMAKKLQDAGKDIGAHYDEKLAQQEQFMRENASTLEYIGYTAGSEAVKMTGMGTAAKGLGSAVSSVDKVSTALEANKLATATKLLTMSPFVAESAGAEFQESIAASDDFLTSVLSASIVGFATLATSDVGIVKNIEKMGGPILEVVDTLSAVPGAGLKAATKRWGKGMLMYLGNLVKTGVNEGAQEVAENLLGTAATAGIKGEEFKLDRSYAAELTRDAIMGAIGSFSSSVGVLPDYAKSVIVANANQHKSVLTPADVQEQVQAFVEDMNDPEVVDAAKTAAAELAVGMRTGELVAKGALPEIDTKAIDAATQKAAEADTAAQAASEAVARADEKFKTNMADGAAANELMKAIDEQANAQKAADEANAELAQAQADYETASTAAMDVVREQARAEVTQNMAAEQEARMQQETAAEVKRQSDNVLAMQADDFVNEYMANAPDDVKDQVRERYMAYDGETQNATRGMVEFASQISKKFNLSVKFTDSHGIFEGAYTGGNQIVLDKNATQGEVIKRVLVHEITHAAENSKSYDKLADAVLTAFYGENAEQMQADLDSIAKQYAEAAGQNGAEVARSELVAKRLSEMLSGNQEAMNRLVEEKPDVATRIWRAIKEFIGKLTGVRDPELDKLMKLEKQLEKALRSRHAGKETRFSIDVNSSSWYDYSRSFSEQVDDWIDGKIPENDTLLVGGTPEILQKIGLSRLPMTIDQTHVDYAINGTKNEDHHMGVEMLKNLPELLKDPVAIIESQTRPNDSLVVIVRGEVNGKQMMAAIEIGGVGVANAETIDVNKISSTQGRSNTVTKLLADALSNESPETPSIYFWNKTEAQNLFADAGVQFPGGAIQDGLIHSIFDAGSPVNKNFIEQIETRQFKRWFGKSKIVDSNGAPKVMYRGGDENIEIFDRKRSRASNLYGRGFYFTDSREHAGQYGNVQEYYLSVKNPLDAQSGAKRITQQQLRAFLEVVAEDEDYGLDNYGYGATVDSVLESLKGKSDFDVLQDINATAIGDFVAAIELFNDVNGTKYDGIITPTETVVFDSKQIKSATDNIGTFDSQTPNVKFSLPSNDILDQRIAQHRNSQLTPAPNDIIPIGGEPAQNYGTGERQFAGQTIQNSAVVPDWIKQEFLRPEELNYEVDTNREQVERSWQRIQENGYEAERDRLLSLDRYSADDTAEANLMMAMALREDTADPATFMALASHYNKEGTKAGQELQARKLFTRMSPTGARVWAAGQMESRLEDHMRTHQPQRRRIDENARRVADQIRDMQSGDEILRLNAGDDFTIDESNNRWGVPINEQQQALIDHYGLNNVARPGIFYNRATTKQRMLEAILATPNPLEVTGLGLNLIQRLEFMQDGEAVITNADLNYIGTQLGQFVAQGGDEGGREADLAVSRAYEAYGNITPSTTREKLRTWRYVSMLLSVPSAIRNVIGNTSQNVVNATAHGIAVELDKAIARATGQRTVEHLNYQERINGWRGFVEETQNTFRDYFIDRSVTQRGNDKYNTNQRGRVYQTQFIETMRNMEGFLMSFGDRNIWRKAYLNSMAEQQKLADRNLLFNDDGTTRTHEQMLEQAEADANYATFTEDNALSNALSQLKNIPGVGEVIDFIMPFTGVPTNITRRMIQYSPIGIGTTIFNWVRRRANEQNFDQRAFVDGISRGLTGTAMFGVGMLLAAAGKIKPGTGDEDDDKKYGLKTAMGGQYTPYVYNPLANEYVSLAAFAPAASPLTMGLAAYEEFKENDDALQALINASFSGADQIFDASYMSGVQDIFKGYGSPAENITNTVFSNAVSQSVPALLTQLSNTIDPYVRDTKDKNAIVQALKSGLINRIPGLRQMLPEKVDVTGQTVRTKEGLRNFYDPFTTTDARKDPAVDELFRLSEALGSSSMLPSDALSGSKMTLTVPSNGKVTVDAEGKETYRKRYGELWLEGGTTIDKKGRPVVVEGVRNLINSSAYRMMDDEERSDVISDIIYEAKIGAMMEALNKYGTD